MREWRMAAILAASALLGASTFAAPAGGLQVMVNGLAIPAPRVSAIQVDQDLDQPDMAIVTLNAPQLLLQVGADVEVAGAAGRLFKGEIVAIEPTFEARRGPVTVRAFDRLHRLAREKKSRVFVEQTDAEIVATVAAEYGFAGVAEGEAARIVHATVFQHNQTDLEFLLERAAAISYEVFVDDTKLLRFRPREVASDVMLGCPVRARSSAAELHAFRVRLARAEQVQRVIVRGWDPVKQQEIVGIAEGRTIDLAETRGDALIGQTVDLGRIESLASASHAHGAAAGTLASMTADDVAAEADVDGMPLLAPGSPVTVAGQDARFNGRYLVVGTSHRYSRGGSAGGYHTLLRLTRADSGVYHFLPEVNDEVIVGFVQGDPSQPVVLGSLWDSPARPEESACENR